MQFITLRRRRAPMLQDLRARPRSAWRRIELEGVSRQYRTPRILDETVTLAGYEASRQNPVVNSGRIADEGEFVDILGPAQSPDSVNSPFAEASG